jgi:C4-dicarboxylate-specific signal transduction histidine kinase
MSASLAHELNQPLGAIVVNSQTLLRWLDRDPPDLAAARRSAERMIRDSQRASSIIHNTRSLLSQSQEGIEQVDLSALVRDTLALMEHELEKERTTVEIVQIARVPSISSVKIEMQQVMINLIANAVQAMSAARSEKRRITIALDAADNAKVVAITVRDTGPGLSADTLEKLFFPFYTTKESGMGMGLSICRSTIEARGGSLVGSNHPEGGAVFEIRLPVEVANA